MAVAPGKRSSHTRTFALDIKPIENELARVKKIAGATFPEMFMTAASPGIIASTMLNAYYKTNDDYLDVLSREMRKEYLAIYKAGLLLQIDAPFIGWRNAPDDGPVGLLRLTPGEGAGRRFRGAPLYDQGAAGAAQGDRASGGWLGRLRRGSGRGGVRGAGCAVCAAAYGHRR